MTTDDMSEARNTAASATSSGYHTGDGILIGPSITLGSLTVVFSEVAPLTEHFYVSVATLGLERLRTGYIRTDSVA